jgi:hypothetical protein
MAHGGGVKPLSTSMIMMMMMMMMMMPCHANYIIIDMVMVVGKIIASRRDISGSGPFWGLKIWIWFHGHVHYIFIMPRLSRPRCQHRLVTNCNP